MLPVEHRGLGLMKQCPLCHIRHQQNSTLFTDLKHIKHLTTSTYRHHIGPPGIKSDNMVWNQGWGWNEMRDLEQEEEERNKEQSQNSTQQNAVHLCASMTICQSVRAAWLVGLLAAWLASFLLQPLHCPSACLCSVLQGWAHWSNKELRASVPCWAELPPGPVRTPEGFSALLQRDGEKLYHIETDE